MNYQNLLFGKNKKKIFKMSSAEFFTQLSMFHLSAFSERISGYSTRNHRQMALCFVLNWCVRACTRVCAFILYVSTADSASLLGFSLFFLKDTKNKIAHISPNNGPDACKQM